VNSSTINSTIITANTLNCPTITNASTLSSNTLTAQTISAPTITASTSLSTPKVIISSTDTNTCYGYQAGNVVSSSKSDTLIGYQAGKLATSGSNNTFVGSLAAAAVTTGPYNTVVGSQSAQKLTTGQYNTILGAYTGWNFTTGNKNTVIGGNGVGAAGIDSCTYLGADIVATTSTTNETVLGYGTTGNGSNTVTMGNSSVTNTYLKGIVNCSSITCSGAVTSAASITLSSAYTANSSTTTSKYIPSTVGNKFYLCDAGGTTFYLPQTSIAGTEVVFRRTYLSGGSPMTISSYDGTTTTLVPSGSVTATNTISLSPGTGITSASFVFFGGVWYQY
jgi:hypothetical protein